MPGVREGSIVGGSVRRRIGPGTGLIAWRDERSEGEEMFVLCQSWFAGSARVAQRIVNDAEKY